MKTHCNQKTFYFQTENPRKIVAYFNGGNITSDASGLLLQQAERITGIISQFAGCYTDRIDRFMKRFRTRMQRTFKMDIDFIYPH
jgi:hypothetical protein